ncbi:MAG: peptidoglycan DD-metalloendopeptidase family protein [Candidatus Paceibacterota bacterium]
MITSNHRFSLYFLIPVLFSLICGVFFVHVYAQNVSQIEEKIELRNSDIDRLEREISQFQGRITSIGREKQTLENEIEVLELSERKLNTDIELAQIKIALAEATISGLQAEIGVAEEKITLNKEAISGTLQAVQQKVDDSLVEAMLRHDNLSDYWGQQDSLFAFQASVSTSIDELARLRSELENKRANQQNLRSQELALQEDLRAKAGLVIENKEEQARILSVTENQESEYQKLLKERKKLKLAFEAEIQELESQLNLNVDPGAIPSSAPGVLGWPVVNVYITQYFGNTAFATSNPQIYSGGGHNGIDLGVGIGTSVSSANSGVVVATGDTDLVCPNASYGRWVLVRHNNGLSTLYAHLSQVSVSQGQTVARGETIAYSGNTGYSTGPHLHFSVYASDGVKVSTMPSRACGGRNYTLPLADQSAYLNPLSFL